MLDTILTALAFATLFIVLLWAFSVFVRIFFVDDPMLDLLERKQAERRERQERRAREASEDEGY